jgi:hypothetical protein
VCFPNQGQVNSINLTWSSYPLFVVFFNPAHRFRFAKYQGNAC